MSIDRRVLPRYRSSSASQRAASKVSLLISRAACREFLFLSSRRNKKPARPQQTSGLRMTLLPVRARRVARFRPVRGWSPGPFQKPETVRRAVPVAASKCGPRSLSRHSFLPSLHRPVGTLPTRRTGPGSGKKRRPLAGTGQIPSFRFRKARRNGGWPSAAIRHVRSFLRNCSKSSVCRASLASPARPEAVRG